jgi:hypothetical protein
MLDQAVADAIGPPFCSQLSGDGVVVSGLLRGQRVWSGWRLRQPL